MGLKGLVLKNAVGKIIGGGFGFAVIHAIVFWIAFFQCGGFHDSVKGLWQGVTTSGSAWASVLKWTGFPLSCVDASGAAFVCVMILNSFIWGVVVGFVIGLLFGRKH